MFSAYAESLIDDLYFIDARINSRPKPIREVLQDTGSSFPIDRAFTTTRAELLLHKKIYCPTAQMSRGKSLEKSSGFCIS